MNWKSVTIVGLILFLAGLLVGFIPMYKKASRLDEELVAARRALVVGEIRHHAGMAYLEAGNRNFGSAQKHVDSLYSSLDRLTAYQLDDRTRQTIQAMRERRTALTEALSRNDAEAAAGLGELLRQASAELP